MRPHLLEGFVVMATELTQNGDTVAGLPRTEVLALLVVGLVLLAFMVAAWSAWREERRRAEADVGSAVHLRGTQLADETEPLITGPV